MIAKISSDLPPHTDDTPPQQATNNGIPRRTLVKAGWIVPTVVALELSGVGKVLAQSPGGGTDPCADLPCVCTLAYWQHICADWKPTGLILKADTMLSSILSPLPSWITDVKLGSILGLSGFTADPNGSTVHQFLLAFLLLWLCLKVKDGTVTITINVKGTGIPTKTWTWTVSTTDYVKAIKDFLGWKIGIVQVLGTTIARNLILPLATDGLTDALKARKTQVCP